jgi:uncharacterized protein GlcG (DUF336 family)
LKRATEKTARLSTAIATLSTGILLAFSTPVMADEEKALTVEIKRLSAESAISIATAAMLECRKQGYQATATVVDKNGIVQAVARDTLAPPISIPISKAKAFTAVNFSADTSSMVSRQNTGVGQFDGVLMSAGGVNINVGGTIYGAVGVSGAPSGETDESCAKAGVAAIAEDLEMAD